MLPNEVFALECVARYAREGLDVKEGGVHDGHPDQFAHCPYPKGMGDDGHYLTFFDHQHQGLLQSQDVGRRCYFTADALLYLNTWPSGFFELYDIYDRFNKIPEEVKRKIGVANTGRTYTEAQNKANSERNSGEKHYNYGRFGALHACSKAIIVIKPDGTKLHFGSIAEAARELPMSQGNLCTHLKSGHVLTQGPRKGYQFFYAAKSNKKAG